MSGELNVSSLKVAELKVELSKRGLPVSGLKKDLAKRLTDFLEGKFSLTPESGVSEEGDKEATKQQSGDEARIEQLPNGASDTVNSSASATVSQPAAQTPADEPVSGATDVDASGGMKRKRDDEDDENDGSGQADPKSQASSRSLSKPPVEPSADEEAQRTKRLRSEHADDAASDRHKSDGRAAKGEGYKINGAAAARRAEEAETMPSSNPLPHSSEGFRRSPSSPSSRKHGHSPSQTRRRRGSRAEKSPSPEVNHRPSAVETASSAPAPQPGETRSLYISNLHRPLTLPQMREYVSQHGELVRDGEGFDGVWLDGVKAHAYITYSTLESAKAAQKAIQGDVFPPGHGRKIDAVFVPTAKVAAFVKVETDAWKDGRRRLQLLVRPAGEGESEGGEAESAPNDGEAGKGFVFLLEPFDPSSGSGPRPAGLASAPPPPLPKGARSSFASGHFSPLSAPPSRFSAAAAATAAAASSRVPLNTPAGPRNDRRASLNARGDDGARLTIATPQLYYKPVSEVEAAERLRALEREFRGKRTGAIGYPRDNRPAWGRRDGGWTDRPEYAYGRSGGYERGRWGRRGRRAADTWRPGE